MQRPWKQAAVSKPPSEQGAAELRGSLKPVPLWSVLVAMSATIAGAFALGGKLFGGPWPNLCGRPEGHSAPASESPHGKRSVRASRQERAGTAAAAQHRRTQREGAGYCSTASGQVAACAFASFVFDDPLEIGIETHPDHRHQGHALTLTAAIALVDQGLQTGFTPVWCCSKQNTGSWLVAQKIGFLPSTDLHYLRL